MSRKFFIYSYWDCSYVNNENWNIYAEAKGDSVSFFGAV